MENKNDKNIFEKIVLPPFVAAYFSGHDIKSDVYDKIIARMPKDNSPQNKERKEFLYNCLLFFTNSKNKTKIDALKAQMTSDGKDVHPNNFATELFSAYPEMFLDYNKDCFAAVDVLPSFVEAFSKDEDPKIVYDKFLRELPDDDAQTKEKKKILENCLNLFKNAKCREEIDALKIQLTGTGRQVSSEELARAISANFPDVVLSTSKRNFAKIVLVSFFDAYLHQQDTKAVYDRFINRIPTDNSSQNSEKRKILENSLDFFRNIKTKNLLNQQAVADNTPKADNENSLSAHELAETILSEYAEIILGDHKRKYDMSDKYCDNMIVEGSLKLLPPRIDELTSIVHDNIRNVDVNIYHSGTLMYSTAFISNESVEQYTITMPLEDGTKKEYIVYSNIDVDKLDVDRDYNQAVFKELLSKNNLELSNAGGYIGMIDAANTVYKPEINVGEQIDSGYGTYRYRVSQKYHLIFDFELVTAVTMYTREHELGDKPKSGNKQELAKIPKQDDDAR